jgi:hypothetical protein
VLAHQELSSVRTVGASTLARSRFGRTASSGDVATPKGQTQTSREHNLGVLRGEKQLRKPSAESLTPLRRRLCRDMGSDVGDSAGLQETYPYPKPLFIGAMGDDTDMDWRSSIAGTGGDC